MFLGYFPLYCAYSTPVRYLGVLLYDGRVCRSVYILALSPSRPRKSLKNPVAENFKIRKKPGQVMMSGQHPSAPACPASRVIK